VYTLYVDNINTKDVKCDMTRGGWTVIASKCTPLGYHLVPQFNKSWNEYKNGFGNQNCSYWAGLDFIYQLTTTGSTSYRVDVWNSSSGLITNPYFITRNYFKIENEMNLYRLTIIGPFSGNISHATATNGQNFSTYDKDNDLHVSLNCALRFNGGWWHGACYSDCLFCEDLDSRQQIHISNNGSWYYFENFEMKLK
jgi:hypothetical protein